MFATMMTLLAEGGGAGGAIVGIIYLLILVAVVAGMWKVFEKAGEPGWACIVPIYNIIVLLKIADKPVWWIVLFIIPVVSLIASIMVGLAIAERFGKGAGFGLLLAFLPMIGYPMLGFGDAEFEG